MAASPSTSAVAAAAAAIDSTTVVTLSPLQDFSNDVCLNCSKSICSSMSGVIKCPKCKFRLCKACKPGPTSILSEFHMMMCDGPQCSISAGHHQPSSPNYFANTVTDSAFGKAFNDSTLLMRVAATLCLTPDSSWFNKTVDLDACRLMAKKWHKRLSEVANLDMFDRTAVGLYDTFQVVKNETFQSNDDVSATAPVAPGQRAIAQPTDNASVAINIMRINSAEIALLGWIKRKDRYSPEMIYALAQTFFAEFPKITNVRIFNEAKRDATIDELNAALVSIVSETNNAPDFTLKGAFGDPYLSFLHRFIHHTISNETTTPEVKDAIGKVWSDINNGKILPTVAITQLVHLAAKSIRIENVREKFAGVVPSIQSVSDLESLLEKMGAEPGTIPLPASRTMFRNDIEEFKKQLVADMNLFSQITSSRTSPRAFNILVLDGGGLKGLAVVVLLMRIFYMLKPLTPAPVRSEPVQVEKPEKRKEQDDVVVEMTEKDIVASPEKKDIVMSIADLTKKLIHGDEGRKSGSDLMASNPQANMWLRNANQVYNTVPVITGKRHPDGEYDISYRAPHQVFDLIVGTSTGTIIGAYLTSGAPLAELQKLYLMIGEKVFDSSRVNSASVRIKHDPFKLYQYLNLMATDWGGMVAEGIVPPGAACRTKFKLLANKALVGMVDRNPNVFANETWTTIGRAFYDGYDDLALQNLLNADDDNEYKTLREHIRSHALVDGTRGIMGLVPLYVYECFPLLIYEYISDLVSSTSAGNCTRRVLELYGPLSYKFPVLYNWYFNYIESVRSMDGLDAPTIRPASIPDAFLSFESGSSVQSESVATDSSNRSITATTRSLADKINTVPPPSTYAIDFTDTLDFTDKYASMFKRRRIILSLINIKRAMLGAEKPWGATIEECIGMETVPTLASQIKKLSKHVTDNLTALGPYMPTLRYALEPILATHTGHDDAIAVTCDYLKKTRTQTFFGINKIEALALANDLNTKSEYYMIYDDVDYIQSSTLAMARELNAKMAIKGFFVEGGMSLAEFENKVTKLIGYPTYSPVHSQRKLHKYLMCSYFPKPGQAAIVDIYAHMRHASISIQMDPSTADFEGTKKQLKTILDMYNKQDALLAQHVQYIASSPFSKIPVIAKMLMQHLYDYSPFQSMENFALLGLRLPMPFDSAMYDTMAALPDPLNDPLASETSEAVEIFDRQSLEQKFSSIFMRKYGFASPGTMEKKDAIVKELVTAYCADFDGFEFSRVLRKTNVDSLQEFRDELTEKQIRYGCISPPMPPHLVAELEQWAIRKRAGKGESYQVSLAGTQLMDPSIKVGQVKADHSGPAAAAANPTISYEVSKIINKVKMAYSNDPHGFTLSCLISQRWPSDPFLMRMLEFKCTEYDPILHAGDANAQFYRRAVSGIYELKEQTKIDIKRELECCLWFTDNMYKLMADALRSGAIERLPKDYFMPGRPRRYLRETILNNTTPTILDKTQAIELQWSIFTESRKDLKHITKSTRAGSEIRPNEPAISAQAINLIPSIADLMRTYNQRSLSEIDAWVAIFPHSKSLKTMSQNVSWLKMGNTTRIALTELLSSVNRVYPRSLTSALGSEPLMCDPSKQASIGRDGQLIGPEYPRRIPFFIAFTTALRTTAKGEKSFGGPIRLQMFNNYEHYAFLRTHKRPMNVQATSSVTQTDAIVSSASAVPFLPPKVFDVFAWRSTQAKLDTLNLRQGLIADEINAIPVKMFSAFEEQSGNVTVSPIDPGIAEIARQSNTRRYQTTVARESRRIAREQSGSLGAMDADVATAENATGRADPTQMVEDEDEEEAKRIIQVITTGRSVKKGARDHMSVYQYSDAMRISKHATLPSGNGVTMDQRFKTEMLNAVIDRTQLPSPIYSYCPASAIHELTVIDGGFMANNPALYAVSEAEYILGRRPLGLVLNIGTGQSSGSKVGLRGDAYGAAFTHPVETGFEKRAPYVELAEDVGLSKGIADLLGSVLVESATESEQSAIVSKGVVNSRFGLHYVRISPNFVAPVPTMDDSRYYPIITASALSLELEKSIQDVIEVIRCENILAMYNGQLREYIRKNSHLSLVGTNMFESRRFGGQLRVIGLGALDLIRSPDKMRQVAVYPQQKTGPGMAGIKNDLFATAANLLTDSLEKTNLSIAPPLISFIKNLGPRTSILSWDLYTTFKDALSLVPLPTWTPFNYAGGTKRLDPAVAKLAAQGSPIKWEKTAETEYAQLLEYFKHQAINGTPAIFAFVRMLNMQIMEQVRAMSISSIDGEKLSRKAMKFLVNHARTIEAFMEQNKISTEGEWDRTTVPNAAVPMAL